MKLLVIAPYFYPKVGGLENYAWHIVRGLRTKYGWEIVVIAANHTKSSYAEDTIEGIKIYRLPYWFKLSNTPINVGWLWDIARIIKKEKPDIVNGHTPVPFIADIGAFASYATKIPFILTYHNDLVKGNVLDLAFKLYYATVGKAVAYISKRIITTSSYYAATSDYLQHYQHKLHIIPPGVNKYMPESDQSASAIGNSYLKKEVVLFVGQLDHTHQHKGLSYLIESMKIVEQQIPHAHLVVIGKGTMIAEYKQMGEKISMEILENISNSQLSLYYKTASVVALPSTSQAEGFGMTLIEAAAHKKPVVGSNIGGIPYVIEHEKTGLLSKPKDSGDLATQILKILNNKELSQKMGEAGYAKVMKEFMWDSQVAKAHTLFSSL